MVALFTQSPPICVKLLNTNSSNDFYVYKIYILVGPVSPDVRRDLDSLSKTLNSGLPIPKKLPALDKAYGSSWRSLLHISSFLDNKDSVIGGNILSNDWDEMDDDEFDELLNMGIGSKYGYIRSTSKRISSKTLQFKDTDSLSIEFITDVTVYDQDTIEEFKNKIEYVTKIPYYKQYVAHDDMSVGYHLEITNGLTVDMIRPNILDLDYDMTIAEVPINPTMDRMSMNIRIVATDFNYKVEDYGYEYTMMSIDSFIRDKTEIQLMNSSDTGSYSSIYHGFVSLYFPVITEQIFNLYVLNENEIYSQFPSVSLDRLVFKDKLKQEDALIQSINKAKEPKSGFAINTKSLNMSFDGFSERTISVRKLFDNLELVEIVLDGKPAVNNIDICIEVQGEVVLMRKVHSIHSIGVTNQATFSESKTLSNSRLMPNMLEICMFPSSTFLDLYVQIDRYGKVLVHGETAGNVLITNQEFIENMQTVLNVLVDKINSLSELVFNNNNRLPKMISEANAYRVQQASVNVMFNEFYNYDAFIHMLDSVLSTNIFKYAKNDKMNTGFIYVLSKNITSFSKNSIDFIAKGSTNTFDYLSDEARLKTMMTLFDSKKIYIRHIKNFLNLEILNLNMDESQFYISFILRLVEINKKTLTNTNQATDKLKLIDPILFNYRSTTLYPRLCQKKMQPVVAKAGEKGAVKYINRTYGRDEYYKCPDKTYNYLGMIIGQHPDGYCLPCCRKKAVEQSVIDKCIANETTEPSWHARTYIQYVMEYPNDAFPASRIIDRKTYLPKYVQEALGTPDLMINGTLRPIEQSSPDSHLDALIIYSHMYDTSITDMAVSIITFLKTAFDRFEYLIAGSISNYFASKNDMIKAFENVFMLNKKLGVSEIPWNRILIDVMYYYGINTFILNDDCDGTGIQIENVSQYNPKNKTILILSRFNQEYKDETGISTWFMLPITKVYKGAATTKKMTMDAIDQDVINRVISLYNITNSEIQIESKKQLTYRSVEAVFGLKAVYCTDKSRCISVETDRDRLLLYILNEKIIPTEADRLPMVDVSKTIMDGLASAESIFSLVSRYNDVAIGSIDQSLVEYIKINLSDITISSDKSNATNVGFNSALRSKSVNLGSYDKYLLKIRSFIIHDGDVIGATLCTVNEGAILNLYKCYCARTKLSKIQSMLSNDRREHKSLIESIVSGKPSKQSLKSLVSWPVYYYQIKMPVLYKSRDLVEAALRSLFEESLLGYSYKMSKSVPITSRVDFAAGFYSRYVYKAFVYYIVDHLTAIRSSDIKLEFKKMLGKLNESELKMMSSNTVSDIVSALQRKYGDKYDVDLIEISIESTLQTLNTNAISSKSKKRSLISIYDELLASDSISINNLFADTLMLKPANYILEMIKANALGSLKTVNDLKDLNLDDANARDRWLVGGNDFAVLKTDVAPLIELIANDLSNPLKRRYLFSGRQIERIVNNSEFKYFKDELIYIATAS